jgi:tetratricopeptide (TPR) repeat protein
MELAALGGSTFFIDRFGVMLGVAWRQAIVGNDSAADAVLAAGRKSLAQLQHAESARPGALALVNVEFIATEATIALGRADYEGARRLAAQAIEALQRVPPGSAQDTQLQFIATVVYEILGRAAAELGDYATAERSLKAAIEARRVIVGEATDDQRWLADVTLRLAMAEARAGHAADAVRTLAPVLKLDRDIFQRNRGDAWVPVELAGALYVQALTEPEHRASLLAEAARLLTGLAPQVQASREVRTRREQVRAAQG